MDRRRIHAIARHLRGALPHDLPVRVRLVPSPRRAPQHGDCTRSDNRYMLTITLHLPTDAAVGVLLHEWAHVISWGLDGDDDHGEMFCEARRVVFDAYLEWLGYGRNG